MLISIFTQSVQNSETLQIKLKMSFSQKNNNKILIKINTQNFTNHNEGWVGNEYLEYYFLATRIGYSSDDV